jgi:hypothetical protein
MPSKTDVAKHLRDMSAVRRQIVGLIQVHQHDTPLKNALDGAWCGREVPRWLVNRRIDADQGFPVIFVQKRLGCVFTGLAS